MSTLKEIRTSRGVVQKAVAARIGIARQTYARLENRPWMMTIGQAKVVCDFLGIAIADVDDFTDPSSVDDTNIRNATGGGGASNPDEKAPEVRLAAITSDAIR